MSWNDEEEFREPLREVSRLRAAVKERCMVFNAVGKESAARHFGVDLDFFFDFSFAQWVDVERFVTATHAEENAK